MDPFTITALIQAGSGAYRYFKAQKGINELEKQDRRKFMDAAAPLQENKYMQQQRMKYGLTPESRQLALNEQMRQERNLLRTPASGQLRDQIGRTAAASRGTFGLQMAAQDQATRDAYAQQVAQTNRDLVNLDLQDISQANQEYLQQSAAYGQARQDARKTMLGSLQGVGMAALGGYYNTFGGNKTPKVEKPLIKAGEKPYTPAEPSLTKDMTPLELNLGGAPRSKYDTPSFYEMGMPEQTFPTTLPNTIPPPENLSGSLTEGMSPLEMGPSGAPGPYVAPEFPKAKPLGEYNPNETLANLYVDMGPDKHMVKTPSGENIVVPKDVKTVGDLDRFLNPSVQMDNYNPMGMGGRMDQFTTEPQYQGMRPQAMPGGRMSEMYPSPMEYSPSIDLEGLSENKISPYSPMISGIMNSMSTMPADVTYAPTSNFTPALGPALPPYSTIFRPKYMSPSDFVRRNKGFGTGIRGYEGINFRTR